jgi:hypothetical protein
VRLALPGVFLVAAVSIPAFAADRVEEVAGWRLSDFGGKPGNDLDRDVSMTRKASGVEIAYKPGPGRSGIVSSKFSGCDSASEFTATLNFKSSEDAIKSVREEIAYNFDEFRKACAATADAEKDVMQGFDKAFETVTQWVKDKPFVFPADAPGAVPAQVERPAGDTI